MIEFFRRLFNHDKIDDLTRNLEVYRSAVERLEEEVKEYKGYKLKYQVTKLYVEDDEGLLELFDIAERNANYKISGLGQLQMNGAQMANLQAQQAARLSGHMGLLNSPLGCLGGAAAAGYI